MVGEGLLDHRVPLDQKVSIKTVWFGCGHYFRLLWVALNCCFSLALKQILSKAKSIEQFRYIKILALLRGLGKKNRNYIEIQRRIINLFYSRKPRSQARILIYRNWSVVQRALVWGVFVALFPQRLQLQNEIQHYLAYIWRFKSFVVENWLWIRWQYFYLAYDTCQRTLETTCQEFLNDLGDVGQSGKEGTQGPPGPKGQKGQEGQGLSGVKYVRWGRTNCSGDAQIVYTGKYLKYFMPELKQKPYSL